MKKINEQEEVKNLKQARAKAINWAEKSYLNSSKNTESKEGLAKPIKASGISGQNGQKKENNLPSVIK